MKSYLNDLSRGSGYFRRGLSLLGLPGIRRYVVVPLLINTLLFAGVIYFGVERFDAFLDESIPAWLDWLRWFLWPLFAMLALFVVFFLFSWVGNLVAAPFNSLLAEAVRGHLVGVPRGREPGWLEFAGEVLAGAVPALLSEFYKLWYFFSRAIPLGLLLLIPGINVVATLLWLGFGAWMLALEYADYPMGNDGLTFKAQRQRLGGRRALGFGFGSMVLLATMVPVLNFLVIPAAVAGATVMWVEEFGPEDKGVSVE